MRSTGGAPGRLPGLLLLLALVLRAGGARGGWVTDLLGAGKGGEVRPAPHQVARSPPPLPRARARRSGGGMRGREVRAGRRSVTLGGRSLARCDHRNLIEIRNTKTLARSPLPLIFWLQMAMVE